MEEEQSSTPDQSTDILEGIPMLKKQSNGLDKRKLPDTETTTMNAIPFINDEPPAEEEKRKEYWKELRQYFRTGKVTKMLHSKSASHLSALLYPYFNTELVRTDYPVWIADNHQRFRDASYWPLSTLLENAFREYSEQGNDANILGDNLLRLEKIVRKIVSSSAEAHSFNATMVKAAKQLEKELDLKKEDGQKLKGMLTGFSMLLPGNGVLIPFSAKAPLLLLKHLLGLRYVINQEKGVKELRTLKSKIDELLSVEKKKRSSIKKGKHLSDASDFTSAFIETDKLSQVIPESGSEQMEDPRYNRIIAASKALSLCDSGLFQKNAIIILEKGMAKKMGIKSDAVFTSADMMECTKDNACEEAGKQFDKLIKDAVGLIAAKRIAGLELQDKYSEEIHDDYFTAFNWQSFTAEEMACIPPVVVIVSASSFAGNQLSAFSILAASGRPVKIIILQDIDALNENYKGERETSFLQEPAALAMAQRNTFTIQSAVINPVIFCDDIYKGLTAFSPALFSILTATSSEQNETSAFMSVSAAVESRIFPEFVYDVDKGASWSRRFDVGMNPQSEKRWPVYPLDIMRNGDAEKLELSFTPADYIITVAGRDLSYVNVPDQYVTEDFLPLNDYLALQPEERYTKIPFAWTRNKDGRLVKTALPYRIVAQAMERLEFWIYLQELGGIKSRYIDLAVEKALKEQEERFNAEREALISEYEKKVQDAEREAAGVAMDKLAAVLLDIDQLSATTAYAAPIPSTEPQVETSDTDEIVEQQETQDEEQQEEESTLSDEAWIDSVRCTTCNDCTDLNPAIFKYNDDKQAYIDDASAGPFAHLVQAAENCPAKCIHPGSPLDPNEPHLDELIKRAEPLN